MKESRYSSEQQDLLFREPFLDESSVRRNGGDPDAGITSPTFFNGIATFDGVTAQINYPRSKLRLCEPERAFSIRTRVYLTDTDASSFIQIYKTPGVGAYQEFRFLISGLYPAGQNDMLCLELWDFHGTTGTQEMRGRKYNQVLTTIALNKWTEFGCSYDGRGGATPEAGICLYMDGVAVDDTDITVDSGGNYQAMEFNPEQVIEVGRNVEGNMDFLTIYNRVLTPEEFSNMYGS